MRIPCNGLSSAFADLRLHSFSSSSPFLTTTTTTMATETQAAPTAPTSQPPPITALTRVASIPLISDSLAAVHATLAGNAYTKAPYTTAQAWGSAAYRVTSPIQTRLAPVIVRADGFANSAIDVVESRYPYPFTAPTEEIYGTLKLHGEHAYGYANKTIDDKVRTPAYGIVQGIDQVRFCWGLRSLILL